MSVQPTLKLPADKKETEKVSDVEKSDILTCDLHNPTRATRIIYDGILGSMKQIAIPAGATKRVTISRGIAEEMRDRNRVKKNSDLVIKPVEAEAA